MCSLHNKYRNLILNYLGTDNQLTFDWQNHADICYTAVETEQRKIQLPAQ